MRKFLSALGILFLILIVAAVGFFGYVAVTGSRLDSSSKAYVDQSIPVIVAHWSTDELVSRASPELKQAIDARPGELQQLFRKLSTLGALKHYDAAKGASMVMVNASRGKIITASYRANATFEHGEAHFMLKLIQHHGQWQYLGFHVESPMLLK